MRSDFRSPPDRWTFVLISCGAFLLLLAGHLHAQTVTSEGTVIVGDKEWRQLTDTLNLTWNEVDSVCDLETGTCEGIVSGVDFTGWTVASFSDLQEMFNHFIPGTDNDFVVGASLDTVRNFATDSQALDAFSAAFSFTSALSNGYQFRWFGWYNRFSGTPEGEIPALYTTRFAQALDTDAGQSGGEFFGFGSGNQDQRLPTFGVWLYRLAAVPPPNATHEIVYSGFVTSIEGTEFSGYNVGDPVSGKIWVDASDLNDINPDPDRADYQNLTDFVTSDAPLDFSQSGRHIDSVTILNRPIGAFNGFEVNDVRLSNTQGPRATVAAISNTEQIVSNDSMYQDLEISSVSGTFRGFWVADPFNRLFFDLSQLSWKPLVVDLDSDGVRDPEDNCPAIANPSQSDVDLDGSGDLCDICPADSLDECDPDGAGASEISADAGGTVTTEDGQVQIDVDPGDLAQDETISVTQTVSDNPDVDLSVSATSGVGRALAFYELEPSGISFNAPVTVTMTADVTLLNARQRLRVDVYRFDDVTSTFVALGADCSVLEDPIGTFTATCTVQLNHFSTYAFVAPRDTDNDGVADNFDGEVDACPTENATGLDVDNDGCIDSIGGLIALLSSLINEGVIDEKMQNSLLSKISNAQKSTDKLEICSAIDQVGAFINQVDAQTGKKISVESAAEVTAYAQSVQQALADELPPGDTCG